jgi:hypothetical protein
VEDSESLKNVVLVIDCLLKLVFYLLILKGVLVKVRVGRSGLPEIFRSGFLGFLYFGFSTVEPVLVPEISGIRNFGYPQFRVWIWVKFGYPLL